MTQRDRMLRGELYDATDPDLVQARRHARDLIRALNDSADAEQELRVRIIAELFGSHGERAWIEPPFYCDYGFNIHVGDDVFFNFNCVVLDVVRVDIGDHVLFGPNVQIYTATHTMDHETRRAGLELAKPIRIGSDVWVGGSAVINPGVSIGDRSVIGSGSVVTRDIPVDVFAAGNPCRVIRAIEHRSINDWS